MITIAEGVELPDELVTEVTSILARRSGGKTYTAKKIAEQVIKARLPIVIIDPLGAFWGLRSSIDGRSDGLPVVIFGGAHADVPLESTIGKEIASVVVDNPGAYIVDLSHFDTKGEEITFMTAFLERLYRYKAQHPSALLLIIDEADTFAPQKPETREIKMLGSMESIVRRGRLRGLGVILISQRASVLNKNVLTQTELLILLQTTSPQDRAAVLEWIKAKSAEEEQKEVMASIGGLGQGEAWLWSPAWLKILQRVQIARQETFDSSKTPKPGEAIIEPAAWAAVDIAALGAKVTAAVERGKLEDVPLLQREIETLHAQIRELHAEQEGWPEARVIDPVAILAAGDLERLERVVDYLRAHTTALQEESKAIGDRAREIEEVGESIGAALEEWKPGRIAPNVATFGRSMATAPAVVVTIGAHEPEPIARVTRITETPDGLEIEAVPTIGKAERAFLGAMAQFPGPMTTARAAFLAGYSPTVSTTRNALSKLRKLGLIFGDGEHLQATPEGRRRLGAFTPAPTGQALVNFWAAKLGKAQQSFFMAIVGEHPRGLSNKEAAEIAGYDPLVSTTRNALSSLRSIGLIEGGDGSLRLSPDLGL